MNSYFRRKLASISMFRSAWHWTEALRRERQWRKYGRNSYASYFAVCADPWGYERAGSSVQEKFKAAVELLNAARGDTRFEHAWEIGCAQGAMTAKLAPLCGHLLAVDYVPLALERASVRCKELGNVSLAEWDLKQDRVPGTFDLIVITDVLGSLPGGWQDIRRARDKLVDALAPRGYLFYGDVIGDSYTRRIHNSWLGRRVLMRPPKILRLIGNHPALTEVTRRETTTHLLVLFRKTS
jgi:SAM-dependent methyltransferase